MNLLQVYFRGNSYGRVITRAEPTNWETDAIRLENAGLWQLAQLFADLRSEEQEYLPPYCELNLARWVARFGIGRFGEREFCRAAARLWIWHEGIDNEAAD